MWGFTVPYPTNRGRHDDWTKICTFTYQTQKYPKTIHNWRINRVTNILKNKTFGLKTSSIFAIDWTLNNNYYIYFNNPRLFIAVWLISDWCKTLLICILGTVYISARLTSESKSYRNYNSCFLVKYCYLRSFLFHSTMSHSCDARTSVLVICYYRKQ